MRYKFRAECQYDADQFLANNRAILDLYNIKQEFSDLPDVDVTFETEVSLEELLERMKEMKDSHVMYQTLKPVEEYSGIRDYNI